MQKEKQNRFLTIIGYLWCHRKDLRVSVKNATLQFGRCSNSICSCKSRLPMFVGVNHMYYIDMCLVPASAKNNHIFYLLTLRLKMHGIFATGW